MAKGKYNQKGYRFYVYNHQGRIMSGWEFKEDANDDAATYGNRSGYKVYTLRFLLNQGIDPDFNINWIGGR